MFPRFLATICTLVFCLNAAAALAQAPSGEISGVVTDASGAPMPGVTITLTNRAPMPSVRSRPTSRGCTYCRPFRQASTRSRPR